MASSRRALLLALLTFLTILALPYSHARVFSPVGGVRPVEP